MEGTIFKNLEFKKLNKSWSDYRNYLPDVKTSYYSSLMKYTWPLLYKAWKENDLLVDKDAARLLCTLGNLFNGCLDEKRRYLNPSLEVLASFHTCLLDALVYNDTLSIDDKGNIVFPGWGDDWIVNPLTFELPDEIPGYGDYDY